ncbi:unnamed protein product [Linum tenue]|uniref:Uncharacterized protein n=1 Tax=Linum tenue TaxID=586396 RepID=A0AAV0HY92_9ROSI|nr:unnamed protein product [Linum tenue]
MNVKVDRQGLEEIIIIKFSLMSNVCLDSSLNSCFIFVVSKC